MFPRSQSAAILFAALFFTSAARAEPADLERARALFDEAGELERQGQWKGAQERLRDALRIRDTPHLRYALGWALENDGHLIDARSEYEVALRLGQRAGIEDVSRLAAARIHEVEQRIPLLQVRVHGVLAATTHVFIDDREVNVHGDVGTTPVDPGPHRVRVERSGRAPTDESVPMAPGAFRIVEVQGDAASPSSARELVPVPESRRSEALPWVLIAGGGAFATGAIVLLVSSSSDASARNDYLRRWCDATSCVNGTAATRPETREATALRGEAYDAASRGNTKQVVGAVLGGIGAVGIATGAYLLLTSRERAVPLHGASSAGLRLDAAPLPGGAISSASIAF